MQGKTRGRRTAIGAGALAVLAAGAGVVSAAIPDGGVIRSCHRTDGLLRVVDGGTACRAGETALSFNQQGPRGATGPTGAKGDTGPQGPAGESRLPRTFVGQIQGRNLPASPGTVASVEVPAGRWLVTVSLDWRGFRYGPAGGNFDCDLLPNGGHTGGRTFMTTTPGENDGESEALGSLTYSAHVTTASDELVHLDCWSIDSSHEVRFHDMHITAIETKE
jgi:hypothetical protein